jgi:RNA polymerase sigma factor (sigma-70 family)
MVEKLAKQIRRMFAPHLDIRDLIQSGYLGLCKAAECYSPARGPFDRYAWFRVRGAIIDSQKRRAYREEQNISLDMISEEHSGELPGRVDLDPAPRPDEVMMAAEREQAMKAAMRRLRREERRVLRSHLEGESLTATARATGIPAGLVKVRLAEAQARMTLTMRAGV